MKRQEVSEKYKWKLSDIYSSDEKWEEDLKKAQEENNFSRFAGKLGDKGELIKFFRTNDEYCKRLDKLVAYAQLHNDEDRDVEKYRIMFSKIYSLFTAFSTETAFFEPEMSKLDGKYLNSLLSDPAFSDYDYQIKKIIDRKPHAVSEAEEKILGMAQEIFYGYQEIFGMIESLDLPLPDIEFEGKTSKLTHGLYSIIIHGDDREKRKEAYNKLFGAYKSLANTIASTYIGNVKSDVLVSRVRKYDSCLQHALATEDVDRAVYDNLLKAVDQNLSSMHRYMADRKKILGYDQLYFYDVYAPLVKGVDFKMSFDDAFDYVVKGLAPLGADYQKLLKKGRDKRWIDVYETDGKRKGAYSAACYGVHPYVLLNYQETINEVFTVAHEMGHALHTYFSQSSQPYAKSQYTIFVAEVASTVNEVLLLKYMLSEAKDDNLKKYLLNYYLDNIRATLHRQAMFAEFEAEAHAMEERGEPLTKDNMSAIYKDLNIKYYGNDIVHDDNIAFEWARVPHFYNAFYVYKYATGITAAINIVTRIMKEGQPAVRDYFEFLKGGSSTDPVSLLKLAGVDLGKPEAYKIAMNEFENTLTEFEKLMGI